MCLGLQVRPLLVITGSGLKGQALTACCPNRSRVISGRAGPLDPPTIPEKQTARLLSQGSRTGPLIRKLKHPLPERCAHPETGLRQTLDRVGHRFNQSALFR